MAFFRCPYFNGNMSLSLFLGGVMKVMNFKRHFLLDIYLSKSVKPLSNNKCLVKSC